ncbi:MAG: hypothetical protein ABW061_23330 [Polyangiaceae bacterium]
MAIVIRSFATRIVFLCLAAPALAACSADPSSPSSEADGDRSSSIGLELQLAPGLTLNQANYVIVGPGGFSRSGAINVSNSSTLSAVISGLPAGIGYSITLTGSATDGNTTCSGAASFDVVAHETTRVTVSFACHQTSSTGSVSVNGTVNVCPSLDGINANPAEVLVGGSVALAATAYDSDNAPAALSYAWSASSGTLSDSTAAAPTFTCTVPGSVNIALSVSDGDATPDCAAQASITVLCTPTSAQVQAILDANCTSCHSGSAPARGLSLVDVKVSIGVAAAGCAQKLRIASGSAARSYLVDKLLGAAQDGACFSGKQMPLGKPALPASDLALISAWINAGTP